jgi:PIN domain nuclease of toxin-antitoxin system
MKGLLDTHTFIWWDGEPSKLSAKALAFIHDPNSQVFFSVVSVWEILIKQQLGKLTLHAPLAQILARQQANGIAILPVSLAHVMEVANLPNLHKDPFDRLLIAQANVEGAKLLSGDVIVGKYPVQILW